MLTIRRFFAYSVVVHIIFFLIVFSIIFPVQDKKREAFFARLVSPEEFLPAVPPSAVLKARPVQPPRPKASPPESSAPKPELQKGKQTVPGTGFSTSRSSLSPPAAPPILPDKSLEKGTEIGSSEVRGNTQVPNIPIPSTKEKLFDRDVIGDIAKRESKKEEKEQTFSFDVKEMRYLTYLRRLKERIEGIWIYPPDAAAKGLYGDLLIKFTIKKNGKLGAVELVRTSGYKTLDDAALRALRNAEPFWPLPDEWGMEAYTIQGHFIYTIYGYYVR